MLPIEVSRGWNRMILRHTEVDAMNFFEIGLVLCLYFLPSLIGWNKRNYSAIYALNFLLGWTVVGWIVALIWALVKDEQR